ncbi:MAG: TetR/AcrR family transcriptional regulator [Anaerolineae bacterium]|nr:TetR/AcrR family transcriptional regulator [Anaerolineae bacterium]
MPYPSQINTERVIETARALLEDLGIEQLSLHRLAEALGVKAPSLYRYFAGKTELLRAINAVTGRQMLTAMQQAADAETDPQVKLIAMLRAYRRFALAHPLAYDLLYSNALPDSRLDPADAEQMALPLQARMAESVGAEQSLEALRGAWALVHGFVMLELAGQFQRGGNVNVAFEAAVQAYLAGWR